MHSTTRKKKSLNYFNACAERRQRLSYKCMKHYNNKHTSYHCLSLALSIRAREEERE